MKLTYRNLTLKQLVVKFRQTALRRLGDLKSFMLRLAKPAKTAVYIGTFLLVLLLIYFFNNEEGQFNPELRENVLSDYDYYMEEYKDEDLENLVIADVSKSDDAEYADENDENLLSKSADDRHQKMDELVIVVVEKDEDADESEEQSEVSLPLDSPSEVPEISEDDVLRENDELVNGLVIDKSDDLLEVCDYLQHT